MDFSLIVLTLAISFLLFFFLHKLLSSSKRQSRNVREVAGAWAIIGHVHLLNGPQMTHKIFAEECFTTNDMAFANQPKNIASEMLGYNNVMFGFGPYGLYWREMRKIVPTELISAWRIDMFGHIRVLEAKSVVKEIYEYWSKIKNSNYLNSVVKMEMKEWFGNLIMNTMVKMLFEVQYTEHRRKRKSRGNKCGNEEDFMYVMLSICEDTDFPACFDADTIIKATCMLLCWQAAAGVDTTHLTLTWILSLLLNNYQSLKKAQGELDTHVGKSRWVQESDIKNLVYLYAIVNESLHLYSPTLLLVSHELIEDCVVIGYDITKGTRLFVNVWKFHHDPKIWPNPHEFKPERFLTMPVADVAYIQGSEPPF
ncbi:hypothetical protein P3S68_026899 [Capsicum galapagoense]